MSLRSSLPRPQGAPAPLTGGFAVRARGLAKRFGKVRAVDGLDLAIPEGSLYALLGPNGAGKTTTINLLTGLTTPDAGEAEVAGFGLAEPLGIKAAVGVVLENHPLFENLTPREYLRFVGEMKGLAAAAAAAEAETLLDVVQLAERGRLLKGLSKGTKQKAAIASAFMASPALVILDEPLVGIDPVAVRAIKDHLRRYVDGGRTVLMSSHILEVVERLCTHVTILHHGRAVVEGEVGTLTRGGTSLEDIFLAAVGAAPEASP